MNIHTSETEFLKTEVQRLRALVRAQQITIDKLEAQPEQKRPQNCGTGYCSCIECVMEPEGEPVKWSDHEPDGMHHNKPEQEPVAIDGNTSDGYHTFNELYEFRKAYNAALFNEWSAGGKCSVHKSWRHHDGELCFDGGWFIVVAVLPQGQISNHYEAKDWDLFDVQETERALFEFDGHTGSDVIARLKAYTTPPPVAKPSQRTWVGLTDEQWQVIADTLDCVITRSQKNVIEAKLRSKNT